MGVLGGLVALRDATTPPQNRPPATGGPAPAPRIVVRVTRGQRRCVVRVAGAERGLAARLSVMAAPHRLVARADRALLLVRIRRRDRELRYVVTLGDGRRFAVRGRCQCCVR